ncbi:hypothetical protein QOT17_020281 [Balamuthia mandrillaris]
MRLEGRLASSGDSALRMASSPTNVFVTDVALLVCFARAKVPCGLGLSVDDAVTKPTTIWPSLVLQKKGMTVQVEVRIRKVQEFLLCLHQLRDEVVIIVEGWEWDVGTHALPFGFVVAGRRRFVAAGHFFQIRHLGPEKRT